MKSFFRKKIITSMIFIGIIIIFSALNFVKTYENIIQALKDKPITLNNIDEVISTVENTVNENIYGKYAFVEGYGFLQKAMGKDEENNFEVVKDENGFLHYTFFGDKANEVTNLVEKTEKFKSQINNKNSKYIYMMMPDKYIKGYTQFSRGIPYNYANETADEYLQLLKEKNIDTIDLRENLLESGIVPENLFYKTDHHWKIETVFWEFGQLINKLNTNYNMNLDKESYYTDKENYNFISYPNSYIGSMGRKTGIIYGGVDDFTLIYPKFKTSFYYYSKTNDKEAELEGRFEEALLTISPFRTEKGIYSLEADKYSSYLFGNRGIVHVVNKENTEGPKILFIKDSFSVPLAAFMSNVCSEIYLIDPRYYKESILDYVNGIEDLDIVFMAFSPQDLTDEFFNLY